MYHPIQEDYTKKVRHQLVFVLFRESESGSSSKIYGACKPPSLARYAQRVAGQVL
jgi:hypothetical protein